MSKLCCKSMDKSIYEYKIIHYDDVFRIYGINESENSFIGIKFCPWCGVNLGIRLAKIYFDILENEYGIEVPDTTNFTNVPEEFKSDEWWKKRGL